MGAAREPLPNSGETGAASGRRSISETSEEINNFQRECRLVGGGPASDLKDVLVGFIIAIFQAGRESGDRLILKRGSDLPQCLGNRRRRGRGCSSETHVGSGLVRRRALAGDEAPRIFEDFSSQTDTPLLCEVMDQISGCPVPPRILSGTDCAAVCLVGVIGFDHGRRLVADLKTEISAGKKYIATRCAGRSASRSC